MLLRAAPGRAALALLGLVLASACPRQTTPVEEPEEQPLEVAEEAVDAPAMCAQGCRRLERCVPDLAGELDGDPEDIAARLQQECDAACGEFENQRSALALGDCLRLDSCEAYWGCVGTTSVRPWLATVAPVGERSCANLCSQASVCAIAKVCESEAGRGKRSRPDRGEGELPASDAGANDEGDACLQDARRTELEERCLLTCEATSEPSRARTELLGCIDSLSCGGLLSCLDSWAETDYSETEGVVPGISPSCDAFCTRAIVCGAEAEDAALEPEELAELKQMMTSTYVECAVQCGKDLEVGGDAAREAFEACAAAETCEAFGVCAEEA